MTLNSMELDNTAKDSWEILTETLEFKNFNSNLNSNYFHFSQNKNSDKLIVIFSGANAKNFTGYKLVEEFNCNKIFLRETNKSWYHGKIENVSNSIDQLIKYLKIYTNQFQKENITFIGSSMGAYAALLIGIKLHVGKIIAFGPQIYINQNFPNNPKDHSYIKYKNLVPLINKSKSNIDIFIGVNELIDLYHVKDITKKNIHIYKIFGQPHNVMFFLNKVGILQEYILHKTFNKDYSLNITNNFYTNFNEESYLEKAIDMFFIQKKYKNAQDIFDNLIKQYPTINTFWKYRGICSYFQKNHSEAIIFLKQAELIVFRDDELHYYLGLCFLNLKEYAFAISEFKFALEFAIDKKITYFIKLAISLRETKEYEEAIKVLKQSLKFDSKNYGTYYQLAKIYKKLENHDLAIKNFEMAKKLNPTKKLIITEL